MEYRKFDQTYVIRMERGEEITEQLKIFAEKEGVKLASVQAIGAVSEFTVGAFDTKEKKYYSNEFKGTFEITSLLGNISTKDGAFYSHLHMTAADETGHAVGGHLNRALISATCEMIVTAIPGTVDRSFSEEVGLNLFRF